MPDHNIILPSKPAVVSENELTGIYEIEGLYPGYGHTLGNSLRRIILSSLPGYAITSVKIDGVSHEFSTMDGVKEDVITLILNLKKVRFQIVGDEPQSVSLSIKGPKEVLAGDIKTGGGIEVANKDLYLFTVTGKTEVSIEMNLELGLGYVPKEILAKDKVEIGTIALDAIFTPIRRVSYEVEHMRVGNRTDYNKLRIFVETDGSLSPRQALEKSIETMITQLKSIIGFKEEIEEVIVPNEAKEEEMGDRSEEVKQQEDVLKTRIEDLNLSVRTMKALGNASIRTLGGLTRKKEDDLMSISGLGEKGVEEIKTALGNYGITLK
ncbi:MAG: DNA-directed RNA polymerase subunit alpha [Candidatus Vogelbacteria bacterium]|nr:DNA-directed RNA polymerase subunit alpha [Candidatus Vogelbacteria bacterium]